MEFLKTDKKSARKSRSNLSKLDQDSTINNTLIQMQENNIDIQFKPITRLLKLQNKDSVKLHNLNNEEVYIETLDQFIEVINDIVNGQNNVLENVFEQNVIINDEDCQKIHVQAQRHYEANIINKNSKRTWKSVEKQLRCECGCERAKGQDLPLCCSQKNDELNLLGSGIILFLDFSKYFALLLLGISLTYGIFSIVTNLVGYSATSTGQCADSYCKFRSIASAENKLDPNLFDLIQGWIGVAICIIWIFLIRVLKIYGRNKHEEIDFDLNSSSDYAVWIDGLPEGKFHEQKLMQFFDNYENKSDESSIQPIKVKNKYNITSIHVYYNMEKIRYKLQDLIKKAQQVQDETQVCLLKDNKQSKKKYHKIKDIQSYKKKKQQFFELYSSLLQQRRQFLHNQSNYRTDKSATVALIQFLTPVDKQNFLKIFECRKLGLIKQLQQTLFSLCSQSQSKKITYDDKYNLRIQRAPEPTDILNRNCERQFSFKRILVIYLITFVIVLFSFGIMTGLTYIQEKIIVTGTQSKQNDSLVTVINIAISVSLQLVNALLWISLDIILSLEYNHTLTDKIISQMNKTLFAMCLNIIALPIITNYAIRFNIYGSNGLAGIVFDYQISVLGIGMIVKLLDPKNLLKRLAFKIKCIRNFLIRFTCQKLSQIDQEKFIVDEVNLLYEGAQFNIAQSYVYIMAATYHAAFFCQLQPSVLFLVTLVIFVFYWVNKFKILRTCKIPELTDMMIFETAIFQAALIPVIYGIGSIVLSYIQIQQNHLSQTNYISGAVAIAVGLFGFINPGDVMNTLIQFFKKCFNCQNNKVTQLAQTSQGFGNQALSDVITEKKVINFNSQKQSDILNRIQSYYKDSNILSLLAFQYALFGRQQSEYIIEELEHYSSMIIGHSRNNTPITQCLEKCIFHALIQQNVDKKSKKIEMVIEKYRKQQQIQLQQQKKKNGQITKKMGSYFVEDVSEQHNNTRSEMSFLIPSKKTSEVMQIIPNKGNN